MIGDVPLQDIVQESEVDGLLIVPATTDLSSADIELMSNEKRSYLLYDALRQPEMDDFNLDFILID